MRDICTDANTSMNMIHHYFGNKEGLLQAVVGQIDNDVLTIPRRLLETPVTSPEEFRDRIELIWITTLEAYIRNRDALVVAVREQTDLPAIGAYMGQLTQFLDAAKKQGIVRTELDSDMLGGAMLDRILNQVHFAPVIRRTFGIDPLTDKDYQQRWSKGNLDLFLNGFMVQ